MTDGSLPTAAGRRDPAERERREWLGEREIHARPGDGSLARTEAAKDATVRQWDVVTPSATRIGRPETPGGDLPERLRRLHEERHPAMAGHSDRMHRLDKARITQALCNALDLTAWERDRVLGIMRELDVTTFGSQRAIPKVALVTIQHVVDRERQRQLGLHDEAWVQTLSPDEMSALYDRFTSIKDERQYQRLLNNYGLTKTNVNRLNHVLTEQLDESGLRGAVFGRSPYRDLNLPHEGAARSEA
jgi:hypothetical protein